MGTDFIKTYPYVIFQRVLSQLYSSLLFYFSLFSHIFFSILQENKSKYTMLSRLKGTYSIFITESMA